MNDFSLLHQTEQDSVWCNKEKRPNQLMNSTVAIRLIRANLLGSDRYGNTFIRANTLIIKRLYHHN